MAKIRKKYIIKHTVAVYATSAKKAEKKLKTAFDNADGVMPNDSDTKIKSTFEGIWDSEKINIVGYDGIKIVTALGHKVLTKYGDEFTIKEWNSETRKFSFVETDNILHESRISFG